MDNTRSYEGGTKNEDVALARCLFADFDGVELKDIRQRAGEAGLPAPTLIVASGHGFHLYCLRGIIIIHRRCQNLSCATV